MSDKPIEIKIDNNDVERKLLELAQKGENLRPLTKNIAGIFASATEENFKNEGDLISGQNFLKQRKNKEQNRKNGRDKYCKYQVSLPHQFQHSMTMIRQLLDQTLIMQRYINSEVKSVKTKKLKSLQDLILNLLTMISMKFLTQLKTF